ncbi:hypothetical protein C8P64_1373 [Christiangramia gaetbulicola]|uniref:Uncharacterized protein n=1 Tax=Christiangramia gaetbulicola TaxID=703340 RepID=A0A2T6AGB6_9FLAO|nr:hypothetical protein [Christiangramia gaetbulicola]PTX42851.1 hypothetical protein C8P64_1373 [Christiangramia gaetbulicola]
MKKILLLALVLLFSLNGFAQLSADEVEYIQSIFGMEKRAAIEEMLDPDENADSFWKLYDQYELERKDLGKNRIDLLEKYAENYESMSNEDVDNLIKESMDLSMKTDKLINKYYKKIKNEVGSVPAAQFYQIEHYLLSEIRAAILGEMDLIEAVKQ